MSRDLAKGSKGTPAKQAQAKGDTHLGEIKGRRAKGDTHFWQSSTNETPFVSTQLRNTNPTHIRSTRC